MDIHWLSVLTSFHNTPIFSRLWQAGLGITVYSAAVVLVGHHWLGTDTGVGAQFHGILGLALGTLLVFRTNTSYDRWWEGRKLWGLLVNHTRNLAIKVQTCVRADAAEKKKLGHWLTDFAKALKGHLRGSLRMSDLGGNAASYPSNGPQHVPAYIATRIYEQFESWRQNDQLGGFELLFLDQHAAALMDICGACERIKNSPISQSYRWFTRQSIAIYLITLPWGLVRSFDWWTVPAVGMLAYFMIGMEMIAERIENPFGDTEDDLMLDQFCETIDTSVWDILASPSR